MGYLTAAAALNVFSFAIMILVLQDHILKPSAAVNLMISIRLTTLIVFSLLYIGTILRMRKTGTSQKPATNYASGEGLKASLVGSFT